MICILRSIRADLLQTDKKDVPLRDDGVSTLRRQNVDIANEIKPPKFGHTGESLENDSDEDELIDHDDYIRNTGKNRLAMLRRTYVSNVDMLQGGNDTNPFSVQEALELTGFEKCNIDELYINEKASKTWKYKIHQVYREFCLAFACIFIV